MELGSLKNLELDKICRICLAIKKEMRPLFGEMVAEMLMEIAKIQIEQLDGWPDKICIQCIHQVSRCHAFKTRVEKSDTALRQYIKGITVVTEEQMPKELTLDVQRPPSIAPQKIQQIQPTPHIQEIHIQRADIPTIAENPTPTMILTNAQLLNTGTHIINGGHLLTTATGQQIIQAPQYHAAHIGQFIQGPNNTIQMITHGAPHPQILQIQRTADDRCEIIVQPEMTEQQQYYDENNVISVNPVQSVPLMVAAPTATLQHHLAQHAIQQQQHQQQHHHHQHHQQQQHHQHQQEQHEQHHEEQQEDESEESHLKDGQDSDSGEHDDSQIDNEEYLDEEPPDDEEEEEEQMEQPEVDEEYCITDCESDDEEKQLAEFMTYQTSCPSPGRYMCNLCRKEFSQPKWLQTHMSSHSNWLKANCKKQPECEICHKSFRGPGMLRMHMKTHEKEDKLPTCSICHKECKSKSILYRHRQTHFEKNFACTLCDKRFSSNYQLNIHVQRHRKQKPHKCPHCEKSFYSASDLKVHVNWNPGGNSKRANTVNTTKFPLNSFSGETFRFPLVASHKSSFRVKKNQSKAKPDESPPEKLFSGNFVVFTVFALLELPPGFQATLKHKTMTFIRQGSQRLKDKPVIGKLVKDVEPPDSKTANFDQKQNLKKLTTSESQRNIGSVTYFLEPKAFQEVCRGRLYQTDEMWLPIKDITVTQPAENRVTIFQSPKGQVEVTLQLCDYTDVHLDSEKTSQEDLSFNIDGPYSPTSSSSSSSLSNPFRFKKDPPTCGSPVPSSNSHKNRFSFKGVKKIVKSVQNKEKNQKGLCLKISTAKIRCGIKVKEDFEAVSEKIYLKTTVLEHEILSATWKSDPFRPALSTRWNQEECTIVLPLSSESNLDHVSIRVALAAKNKVGKKIYLGQVFMGPNAPSSNQIKQDQWRKMIAYKGSAISVWHSLE